MENVKLSIVCITYNHEHFIRDCLEGFVMQKTNFPFEILVNDDASTDKTADIIREYEAKYPHLFRCVYQMQNAKKSPWRDVLFPMIRGKYVALCEGDDYWTDPLKLQKQVDFLDAHPDFSVCFHPVRVHWDDGSKPDSVFPEEKGRFYKTELTLADLSDHNFIQTNSVVYRWRFHKDSLELIPKNIAPMDWFLHLLHAQTGKIAFLPDIMGVYRRHQSGIWTGAGEKPEWFIRFGIPILHFYLSAQERFGKDYKNELEELSLFTYLHMRKADKDDLIKVLFSVYPPPLKYLEHTFMKYLFYAVVSRLCFGKLRRKIRNKRRLFKKILDFK